MSKRPWTPGPYSVEKRLNKMLLDICSPDRQMLAVIVGPSMGGVSEWRENATLFSAAPALYEALSECVEHLLEDRRVFVHIHAVPPAFDEASIESFAAADLAEMDERIEKARAALAAAEGKQ